MWVKFIYSEKATKFLRNLHRRFVLCSNGQIYCRDFAKFCDILRIYELYRNRENRSKKWQGWNVWGNREGTAEKTVSTKGISRLHPMLTKGQIKPKSRLASRRFSKKTNG